MSAGRTFVIGDIHGCLDEVDILLDHLDPTTADTVVFLGDYIDRGPASREVIDRLLRLRQRGPRCVFLKGNHEDMLLGYLGGRGHHGSMFLYNGGDATLRSYGVDPPSVSAAQAAVPAAHVEFLRTLELQYVHGPFLCTHAGVDPRRPLNGQREEDLLWIRDEFLFNAHPFPFTVLFGHTPQRDVLVDLPYKIGLDTGLVYWNKLSCLELQELRLYQLRRGERSVESRDCSEWAARLAAAG